jgi:hypothetical protein
MWGEEVRSQESGVRREHGAFPRRGAENAENTQRKKIEQETQERGENAEGAEASRNW